MASVIEFYNDKGKLIAHVTSSMAPHAGSRINIRGQTWAVSRVTYALDHSDEPNERCMRACVDLVRPHG